VIGGRLALVIEPDLIRVLTRGRSVALVSGTNGKTTTTRLLASALGGPPHVATSSAGANMPSGLATALTSSGPGVPAVLEVDEGYLAKMADESDPAAIALLNLSRDQLDRVSEVRMLAGRWREGLAGRERTVVVANADDPMVAWGAGKAPKVVWVAAGQLWHSDAVGCPACEGRIVFSPGRADLEGLAGTGAKGAPGARPSEGAGAGGRGRGDWWCTCGFRRPLPDAWLEGEDLVTAEGRRLPLRLSLPGRCNRANAAIAALCACLLGVDLERALDAMAHVGDVEGRFSRVRFGAGDVRLLLAKNPAGWTELLDLLRGSSNPVVVGINARVADGRDPSWLWDVPFEQLAGRRVVATGERCMDLAVRLRHAGVDHLVEQGQLEALRKAPAGSVDYVGNYTAFQQLRRALSSAPSEPAASGPVENAPAVSRPAPRVPAGVTKRSTGDGVSALRVVLVHPDLLGTYGDGGNARVLADRAIWRGLDVELVTTLSDVELPADADLYCLGGGEDGPQVQSARLLRKGALHRAVDAGAGVLAVCAGYQVVGESFPDANGAIQPGAELLDVFTVKGPASRAVGELLAEPFDPYRGDVLEAGLSLGVVGKLTGFENHGGVTRLGSGVRPLARVLAGIGNGAGDRTEGAVAGRVVGTYMHGPVLARNPSLADSLLGMVTGVPMTPLDDEEERALRAERIAALRTRRWRTRPGVRVFARG